MNQSLPHQFGIVWYFYSQAQQSVNLSNQVLTYYLQLGIQRQKAFLETINDLRQVVKSDLWEHTSLTKVAILDYNDESVDIKSKKLIANMFKNKNSLKPEFYSSQTQLKKLITKGYSEMLAFRETLELGERFLPLAQDTWSQTFSFTLKVYSAISDDFITKESFVEVFQDKIGQISSYELEQHFIDQFKTIEIYRHLLICHLKNIHLQSNCQKIGYPLRQHYHQIKKKYQQSNQYAANIEEMSCWKVMREDKLIMEKGQYCLHKTLDYYFLSKEKLQEEVGSSYNNAVIVQIILKKQSAQLLNSAYQKLDHGFCILWRQYAVVNCLNILRLIKIQRMWFESIKAYMKLMIFEIVPFQDLVAFNSNIQTEQQRQIARKFKFLANYLNNTNFSVSLEAAYHESHQYELAANTIRRKEEKKVAISKDIQAKLGLLLPPSQMPITYNIEFINRIGQQDAYKKLYQQYRQQLVSSPNNFHRYCTRIDMEIDIALIIGLGWKSTTAHIFHLKQAVDEVRKLASRLSLRAEKELYRDSQENYFCCLIRACKSRKDIVVPQDQIFKFKNRLMDQLFPKIPQPEQAVQLKELKIKFCWLFKKFQNAISKIKNYGIYHEDLQQVQTNIFSEQLKEDVLQIENDIKTKQSGLFQSSFLNQKLQEYLQQLQPAWEIISSISKFPLKICRSDSIIQSFPNSQIIDWIRTQASLASITSKLSNFDKKIDEAYSLFQTDKLKEKQRSKVLQCFLQIFRKKITFLEDNGYLNHSFAVLQLYRRSSKVCYQIGNIGNLKALAGFQFVQPQNRNVIVFKTEIYEQIASLYFKKELYQQCIYYCKECLELYKKVEEAPSKQLDMQILRFSSEIKWNKTRQRNRQMPIQQLMYQKNRLQEQARQVVRQWTAKLDKRRVDYYRVQMELLIAQIMKFREDQQRFDDIITYFKGIQAIAKKIYQDSELRMALISFEIARLYFFKRQSIRPHPPLPQQFDVYYDKMVKAFQQPAKGQEQQFGKYKWALALCKFYKERSKGLKFIDILPARDLIQKCLSCFEDLKKSQPSFQFQEEYNQVYQMYSKFMEQQLICFPKKKNMYLAAKEKKKQQKISDEQMNDRIQNEKKSGNYNPIYWFFFLRNEHLKQIVPSSLPYVKSNVLSYQQLKQKVYEILEANEKKFKIEGKFCSTINLMVSYSKFKSFIIEAEEINFLQNLDQVFIVAKQSEKTLIDNIRVHILQRKIQCPIIFFESDVNKTIEKEVKNSINSYECGKIYPNALLYNEKYTERIDQFHTIILSSLNQQVMLPLNENDHSYLMTNFLLFNPDNKQQPIVKQFVQNGVNLSALRMQIKELHEQSPLISGKYKEYLYRSKKSIEYYQNQSVLYPFINNTLRSVNESVDFNFRGIQKFVYTPYHAINYLHQWQWREGVFKQNQLLVLWRKAEMNQGQQELISNMNRPLIEFLSFLSTTKSISWIFQKLGKDLRKNGEDIFKKTVIFKIKVRLSKRLRTSDHNHGFYQLQDKKQQEFLFNLMTVFRVESVQDKIIQDIYRDCEKILAGRIIKLITLTLDDFPQIQNNRTQNDPSTYLFQVTQSSFLKKKRSFELIKNQLKFISYGIIQAFEDLGKPMLAEKQIMKKIKTVNDADFVSQMVSGESENLVMRAARNCLKMGNIELAQQHVNEYLPKLQKLKEELSNHQRKQKATKIYQMKLQFMELFLGEKLGFEKDEDITLLEKELKTIDENESNIDIKTKQISLRLYRSIYYYELGDMCNSFIAFENTLEQLEKIIQKIEQLPAEKQKIVLFCKKIDKELKERICQYQKLNENYEKDLLRASGNVHTLSSTIHKSLEEDPLRQNAKCLSAATGEISCDSSSSTSQIRRTNQEIQILFEASKRIQEKLALNFSEQDKEQIKNNNFQLLGKLQQHKENIHSQSDEGMAQLLKDSENMMEDMIESHIRHLENQGHTRDSPNLIRAFSRLIKQKVKKGTLNFSEFQKDLNKNIHHSSSSESRLKILELSRLLLLKAEVNYAQIQKNNLEKNDQLPQSQNLYNDCLKSLDDAQSKLLVAFNIHTEENENRSCFDCLKFWDSKKEMRKMFKISNENIAINILKAKIYHQKIRVNNQTSKSNIEKLFQNLEILLKERDKIYKTVNQEITLWQLKTLYFFTLPKQISPKLVKKSFLAFTAAMKQRQLSKGQNNIQNSVDCLEIFQLSSSGLKKRLGEANYEFLYPYIEKGAHSYENNILFWRFNICIFNRIKLKQSHPTREDIEEHTIFKLNIILEILMLFQDNNVGDHIAVQKIELTFRRFVRNFIIKRSLPFSEKIDSKYNKIEKCLLDLKKRNKFERTQNLDHIIGRRNQQVEDPNLHDQDSREELMH